MGSVKLWVINLAKYYLPNAARTTQVGVALSNSFAFGGFNVMLAFGRV
jgi:3-oxoacyl-(acyl-carrier-protein) synthase